MGDKLYKILKLNMKDIYRDENNNVIIDIKEDELTRYYTLIKEPEIVRIMKTLDKENNNTNIDGYTYIKDLVAIKSRKETYEKIIKESKGIIDIHLYKLKDNNERELVEEITFKRLMVSSGNARNKKILFVKEELFDKVNEILLCGLDKDMKHDTFSKFNSYYAMAETDSVPVVMPNLVVIKDYIKEIEEEFDCVREVGEDKYEVENNKKYNLETNCFDGAGLVDIRMAEKWSKGLGLDYIPAAWQFRAIPGIKGNLYTFNIREFAKQNNVDKIKDICGNEYDSNKIDCILTESQFKFYKQYVKKYGKKDAINKWKEEFNKECNGYKRTFNISKYSFKFKKIKDRAVLSYQPLQTLNLTLDDIKELCAPTVEFIKKISTDVNEFLKFRGVINSKINEDGEVLEQIEIPPYYEALQQDHSLFYSDFIQKKIKQDIEKFKKRAEMGGIFITGNFQTWIPDILALAEWAFSLKVKGGLKAHEAYSRYWSSKKIKEIDIIRFPHIANEHVIAKVVNPNIYWTDGNDKKHNWYEYMTEGVVTNIYDSTALKLGGADFDNDHVLTNTTLLRYAKKQRRNTILEIPQKNNFKKEVRSINDMDELIDTDIRAMNSSIGEVVNKVTKLWMLPKNLEINEDLSVEDSIKIMSIVCCKVIDFAKHGIMAHVPRDIEDFLKNINKPIFQSIKYKKQFRKNKIENQYRRIIGEKETEKFDTRDCTMNRLYNYMREQIDSIEVNMKDSCKDKSKYFDFKKLLSEDNFNIYNKSYKSVRAKISRMKEKSDDITKKLSIIKDNDFYDNESNIVWTKFYSDCKSELLDLVKTSRKMDKETLIDYAVQVFFQDKKFIKHCTDHSLLWNLLVKN